jgi:hypothetical protein
VDKSSTGEKMGNSVCLSNKYRGAFVGNPVCGQVKYRGETEKFCLWLSVVQVSEWELLLVAKCSIREKQKFCLWVSVVQGSD